MVASQHCNSSLSCELRIIKAKNIELKSNGGFLFVRYYLSACGNSSNKRIQLSSKEISSSSRSHPIWNESFSLDCLGSEDSIAELNNQTVVFELRWRSYTFLGGKRKSKVLGRAEIPWRRVFESPDMEMESWITMIAKRNCSKVVDEEAVKSPSLLVAMKVRVSEVMEMEKLKRRSEKLNKCNDEDKEHGSRHNFGTCNCIYYEIFALVAALEAL